MKASEALKLAQAHNLQELPRIKELIEAAARQGNTDVWVDTMTPEVREALKEDGYKVVSMTDPREGGEGGWQIYFNSAVVGSNTQSQFPNYPPGVRGTSSVVGQMRQEREASCKHSNIGTDGGGDYCQVCGKRWNR